MKRIYLPIAILSTCFLTVGCAERDGSVNGRVSPSSPGANVIVTQGGKAVTTLQTDEKNGSFNLKLRQGTYDIAISSPNAQFPIQFSGIAVRTGQVTTLPPIDLTPPSRGTAVLSGHITPAATVSLYLEGKERATVNASADGAYSFTELTPGSYALVAKAAGYASDSIPLVVTDQPAAADDLTLLFVSPVEGVDWTTEKIKVTGNGVPPANAANATIRREMARRAALTDAQRRLVNAVAGIKLGPDQSIGNRLSDKKISRKIDGFVKGYHVTAERELNQGRIEIDVELPLTGRNGLSRYLSR